MLSLQPAHPAFPMLHELPNNPFLPKLVSMDFIVETNNLTQLVDYSVSLRIFLCTV